MCMAMIRKFVAALTFAAMSQLASGAIVFDNLGSAPYNANGYGSFGLIDGVRYHRGIQFTAAQSVYLSTLEVAIGQALYDGTTQPGTATIQLMTDSANTPGAVLQTWTSANQSSFTGGLATFAPAT